MSPNRERAAPGRPRQVLPALTVVLLCAASAFAQTPAAAGPGATTDKTVPVAKGSRLTVSNDAGEVVIKTWNQESLRVRASHSDRVSVDIQNTASIISIRSRATQGRATVDYEITAPAWLPIKVSGQFPYIGVEGSQNEVSAETVRGDIVDQGRIRVGDRKIDSRRDHHRGRPGPGQRDDGERGNPDCRYHR